MGFTVRDANVSDAVELFDMVVNYHDEVKVDYRPFINSRDVFLKEAFDKDAKIKFFIAEYQGNILGYCAYLFSYSIYNGVQLCVKEIFIKKDYRKLGVSVFMFSKFIDIAFEKKCYWISWNINIKNSNVVEIEEKAGVIIDKDMLTLNIKKEDIYLYLKSVKPIANGYSVRLVKTFELPDVFECITNLATLTKKDLVMDIYKLMKDTFSSNPKIKIIVVLFDDIVIGFMSFFNSYCTCSGKMLEVDQVYVKKEHRSKGIGQVLIDYLFKYAYNNDYTKVETHISKFQVEKIERLKEYNIYPYPNLRLAHYDKEEYKKMYSK